MKPGNAKWLRNIIFLKRCLWTEKKHANNFCVTSPYKKPKFEGKVVFLVVPVHPLIKIGSFIIFNDMAIFRFTVPGAAASIDADE